VLERIINKKNPSLHFLGLKSRQTVVDPGAWRGWKEPHGLSLQILMHLDRAQEGREVQTNTWPWGTCHPLGTCKTLVFVHFVLP
jgi:hypothetical protein